MVSSSLLNKVPLSHFPPHGPSECATTHAYIATGTSTTPPNLDFGVYSHDVAVNCGSRKDAGRS